MQLTRPLLSWQVVLPDRHRADHDTVIFLPAEHAADDADTAEQRGAVATLQQVHVTASLQCC